MTILDRNIFKEITEWVDKAEADGDLEGEYADGYIDGAQKALTLVAERQATPTDEEIEEAIYNVVAIWAYDEEDPDHVIPWSEVKDTDRYWQVDGAFDPSLIKAMAREVMTLLAHQLDKYVNS